MKRKTVWALTVGFIGGFLAGWFGGRKFAEEDYARFDDDYLDDEDDYEDFDDEDDFDDTDN